jgi:hypothetical protein
MERLLNGPRARYVPLALVVAIICASLVQSGGYSRLWLVYFTAQCLGLHFGLDVLKWLYRSLPATLHVFAVPGLWLASGGIISVLSGLFLGLMLHSLPRLPMADILLAVMALFAMQLVLYGTVAQLRMLLQLHRQRF